MSVKHLTYWILRFKLHIHISDILPVFINLHCVDFIYYNHLLLLFVDGNQWICFYRYLYDTVKNVL